MFLYDHSGAQKEVSPLCVLDFYVHESRQRRGYGKLLFEFMLKVRVGKFVRMKLYIPNSIKSYGVLPPHSGCVVHLYKAGVANMPIISYAA